MRARPPGRAPVEEEVSLRRRGDGDRRSAASRRRLLAGLLSGAEPPRQESLARRGVSGSATPRHLPCRDAGYQPPAPPEPVAVTGVVSAAVAAAFSRYQVPPKEAIPSPLACLADVSPL